MMTGSAMYFGRERNLFVVKEPVCFVEVQLNTIQLISETQTNTTCIDL